MAPEILEGNYDERCDIWSCGVIMHMLLTGNPPFTGDDNSKITKKIKEGKINFSGTKWKNISNEAIK